MVAKGHKIVNVPFILKVCDVIFRMLAKQIIGHFLGIFEEASTFLTPRKKNWKWPIMCFARIKK